MRSIPDEIAAFHCRELEDWTNLTEESLMAGYVKTDMSVHGLYKPGREEIAALVAERFALTIRRDCERTVQTLGVRHIEKRSILL